MWANIDPTACNISGGKKLTWMAKANLNWHGLASTTLADLFTLLFAANPFCSARIAAAVVER